LASRSGAAVGTILVLGGVALPVWAITGADVELIKFGELGRPSATPAAGDITRKTEDEARTRVWRTTDRCRDRPRSSLTATRTGGALDSLYIPRDDCQREAGRGRRVRSRITHRARSSGERRGRSDPAEALAHARRG